ncbi:MAG: 6-phosphofructokinase [Christensenellales bacterium]|jgi:phosphofructokinase-like protein
MKRRIGILTGGGDCPGLNAVIRGVVEVCSKADIEVVGLIGGWRGALYGEHRVLTPEDVEGIQTMGGTIIESSRTNVKKTPNGPQMVIDTMNKLGLEALVAIGGDDTLGVANFLRKEHGVNVVGVPKTIDNDLSCTDFTFGFDTAANIAMECIDRLHTTAASHARCFVVECMGRDSGWITLYGGWAADAHIIVIPEFPMSMDDIMEIVKKRYNRGKRYTVIAVAEGVEIEGLEQGDLGVDAFGHRLLVNSQLAKDLAKEIEKRMRADETLDEKRKYFECRSLVLGHLQRSGAPSAFDRILGSRMGVKAGELVVAKDYGNMVALRGTEIVKADLDMAVSVRKDVPASLYEACRYYFR